MRFAQGSFHELRRRASREDESQITRTLGQRDEFLLQLGRDFDRFNAFHFFGGFYVLHSFVNASRRGSESS